MVVVWTDYMQYKAKLRGFDIAKIENIVKASPERYSDTATGRRVAVGHHDNKLVMVSSEADENLITPVTVHVTTREQINFRIRTGRFIHE
jgi:esterase/lipase superfamily enzyme